MAALAGSHVSMLHIRHLDGAPGGERRLIRSRGRSATASARSRAFTRASSTVQAGEIGAAREGVERLGHRPRGAPAAVRAFRGRAGGARSPRWRGGSRRRSGWPGVRRDAAPARRRRTPRRARCPAVPDPPGAGSRGRAAARRGASRSTRTRRSRRGGRRCRSPTWTTGDEARPRGNSSGGRRPRRHPAATSSGSRP